MEQEFKFLSISSIILKVLAWISAAFFVLVSIIVFLGFAGGGETPPPPRLVGLLFLFGGGFYFIMLYSVSEGFRILVTLSERINKVLSLLEGKPS